MTKREKRNMTRCFKRMICNNLDNDITTHILNTISKGYTIKNITHSIYDIVKINKALVVFIEVKCFNYVSRKKCTGYFALEYAFFISYGYRLFLRHGRSMSPKMKTAAGIPYGGWFKDKRQTEDEERVIRNNKAIKIDC